jgi:hypothetical protein
MPINPANIAGYYTLRRDLMHIADETNRIRLDLIEVQRKYSETVTQLIEASDRIFPKSLNELTPDGELKKEFGGPKRAEPETVTDVQSVADYMRPSRRNCGLCGKPGHRAPNCPEAHTIREKDKAEKEANGGKKKRKVKPLSPERKAQLAETLKKARAARKGKK